MSASAAITWKTCSTAERLFALDGDRDRLPGLDLGDEARGLRLLCLCRHRPDGPFEIADGHGSPVAGRRRSFLPLGRHPGIHRRHHRHLVAPRLDVVELERAILRDLAARRFAAALRLEQALPKMLAAAPAAERENVKANFYRVAAQPLGFYALMDYVNFKGEGISPTERYNGQGWGLLQVLETMSGGPALPAFAAAADQVLTRRVKNSPPARNEVKWLPGWRNRLKTYRN